MEDPWTDIVMAWCSKGHFGLTIPFLFGGILNHPAKPLEGEKRLKDKFHKMLELVSEQGIGGRYARLAYCDKADDLIIAPVNRRPEGFKRLIDAKGNELQLWVSHDLEHEDSSSLTVLAQTLWNRYGAVISQGKYSRKAGEYGPFDEEDNILLSEAYERCA